MTKPNQSGEGGLSPLFLRGIAATRKLELQEDFERFGECRIVTTVRHTGTHSIKEQFPEYKHWHCNPQVWQLIQSVPADVIVTYRDPLRTAASWYNRAQLPRTGKKSPHRDGCIFSWKEAWFYYGKILETHPTIYRMEDLEYKLYTHPDKGAHALLDAGDLDGYYKLVDKKLIDYAYDQIHSLESQYVEKESPG